jgi:hypothetical protein
MDFVKEMDELKEAELKIRSKFMIDIGKTLLNKFKDFGADCIWFSFTNELPSKLKEISVSNKSGDTIVEIPIKSAYLTTDFYEHEINYILTGFNRAHFTVSIRE